MADRVVSVKLKADVGEYTASLAKAAAATKALGSSAGRVKVDADTSGATSKLNSVGTDVRRLDGKTARVRVDVQDTGAAQRAAGNIQTLMAAALATSPALGSIGAAAVAGLGAVAPLAASAAAGLGVLALGFSGVGDAVKLVGQRHDAVAATTAKAAASQMSSAAQVQSAQASLANAQANAADSAISAASRVAAADQNLSRARQDAAEGVARAQQRASDDVDSALRQQERAQRTLSDAQEDARRTQEDLTYARADARRELEDMNAELRNSSLDEESAAINVERAQERVNKVIAKGAESSALDRREAENAHKQAVARLDDLRVRNARLADDTRVANARGVDGADEVVAARERVGDAEQAVADAARAAADAAIAVDRARIDGAAEVARAQRDGAEKIADAQAQVADAVRAQASQQRQSAYSIEQAQKAVQAAMATTAAVGASSLDTINQKLAEVAPSTRAFAEYVDGTLQPAFKRLQETAAAGLLPGVQQGLDSLLAYEPEITRFVGTFAKSLGGLTRDSLQNLSNPQWRAFFDMLQTQGVPQLESMWRSGDNLAESFASIMTAFAPLATDMAAGIEDLTEDFATWSANLSESEGFHAFEAYVRENWPKIQEIIGNVADIVGDLIEAGAPIGGAMLTGFQLLTDVLSGLPVGVVEALLVAFIGYKTVQSVVGTVTGIANSMLALKTNITGLPEKVGTLKGALAGLGTGVAVSIAVAGATKAVTDIQTVANAGKGAADEVDDLKLAIDRADGDEAKFAATQAALDGLKAKAADAQKILDEYNNQNWFDKNVWENPFGSTADVVDAKKSLEEYRSGIEALEGRQADLKVVGEETNTVIATQGTVIQNMVDSASGQLGIYQQLLADKQAKEAETAAATAAANGQSTSAVQQHVADVNVSLEEYAAALDADVAKKDAWREDIKAVTERGGVEVGAALLAMGEEGARIADNMANATDEDFKRMADSMVNNARNGGAAAAWEMDQAMKIMTLASRDGTKLTAGAIAEELNIGVADAARIAAGYGITLAKSINPVLHATGHERIAVLNGQRVPDFWSGGYTGDGDKYEPKGVVHGGEYVVTKERTAALGVDTLENLESVIGGYADGGLVAFGKRLQGMGARVAENPAFPPLSMTGHGKTSLHYSGNAIDVNTRAGTSALEQRELAPMAALARQLGFRTIFMAPGHFNHLHVDTGGAAGSMGSLLGVAAPVVLPKPPSMSPFGAPISTAGDAAMQHAHDTAQAWVDASTIAATEPSPGTGGSGPVQDQVRAVANRYGWGGGAQWDSLSRLIQGESGWNPKAANPTSSARGLFQKMTSLHGPVESTAAGQAEWGLKYIQGAYGTPANAFAKWSSRSPHWYDDGGMANGVGFMPKNTLEPERVLSPRQTAAFEQWMTGPHSREFSGGASGSASGGSVIVKIEGATISGKFEIGGDGLARIVDGRIVTVLTGVTNRAAYNG